MTKKINSKIVCEISPYNFEGPLDQVKEWLETIISAHGTDSYSVYTPPYDSDDRCKFDIMADLEETDEEYERRLRKEQEFARKLEERELQEYQRLSAKFGKS